MQALCLPRSSVYPRLFQQACRLASTRSHGGRSGLQRQVKLQPVRPQARDEDDGDGIRWFEQDVDTGVTRRVAGNPEETEATELRAKIAALEAELKVYESDEDEGILMELLTPEEQVKVQQALKEKKETEVGLTAGLDISMELPPMTGPLLNRLNASLKEAALSPENVKRRKELWRWYKRAKHNISILPRMMPARAWDVLWGAQSVEDLYNRDRLQHLHELTDDMASAGHALTSEQKCARIDALISFGKAEDAVLEWEDEYEQSRATDLQLLDTGIAMFTQAGHLDRAFQLLWDRFESHPLSDPRIIVRVLHANIAVGNDHLAFSLYLLLRAKLQENMVMDDYDAIVLAFLQHDKKDLALAVFRDMMMRGPKALPMPEAAEDQEEAMQKNIVDRMDALDSFGLQSSEEISKTALIALSSLPVAWQNRFFYASWLKKLIGIGELDASAKVIELMYERGVEPDAKHVNGLVGAFLRSGDTGLEERGEQLAWAMVQQRLEFAHERRRKAREKSNGGVEAVVSVNDTEEGVSPPLYVLRPTPVGTLETFNVLANHYLNKHHWPYVAHLFKLRRPAELHMDAYFMNQYLYMQLESEGQKRVWREFIANTKFVRPDAETYNCLWTAELRELDQFKTPMATTYPLPRPLFRVMVVWQASLDEKGKAVARADFGMEIYTKVVQCFCIRRDFRGLLVAIHGMAQLFGIHPDAAAARMVTEALSNLYEYNAPTLRGRLRRKEVPLSKQRLDAVAGLLDGLMHRRAQRAAADGIDMHGLTGKAKLKESLNLLSELVRVVLVRNMEQPELLEQQIEAVAREVGLPGITTGDVDATNV